MNLLYLTHHRRFKCFARPGLFARLMVEAGHQVTVVCTADTARFTDRESEEHGVRYLEVADLLPGQLRSGWDPVATLRRLRRLAGLSFDALHVFETRPATIYPALHLARRTGLPLVMDWNDWWGRGGLITELRPRWYQFLFEGFETFFEEHFRTRAAATTVISHALGERAAHLGVPRNTIHWIPGAADIRHFQPMDQAQARATLGLDQQAFLMGFSAMDVVHDAPLVFAAAARVIRNVPEARLIMTGRDQPALHELARQHALSGHFQHLGLLPYDQLPVALAAMDVALLPFSDRVSNLGRWPNKVGDYLACARPVITQPVGEMRTFFRNGDGGLLAGETPEAFAAAILELARDPARRIELGRQARALAERELAPERMTQRLLRVYATLPAR